MLLTYQQPNILLMSKNAKTDLNLIYKRKQLTINKFYAFHTITIYKNIYI